LTAEDLETYLTYLAAEGKVAASTQNQALSAILFLYKEVLDMPIETNFKFIGAKKPKRLPVVLTNQEVHQVLDRMVGTTKIIGQLLYGSGLRISEAIRLRVQNIDFGQGQILVRDGKGAQDRITMLPEIVVEPLREHLIRVEDLHQQDLKNGLGRVFCPMPWPENILMLKQNGSGNTSSHQKQSQKADQITSCGVITSAHQPFSQLSITLPDLHRSISM